MIRIVLVIVVLGAVAVSGFYRMRADRLGGPQETPRRGLGATVLVTIARLALLAVVVIGIAGPGWAGWSRLGLPEWARWSAVALAAGSVGLLWWMFHHLGRNITPTVRARPDATLVTSGPYRFLRHPLYSFAALLLLCVALAADSGLLLGLFAVSIAVIIPRARIEERNLVATFGDRYRTYQARTGRLLPAFRRPAREPEAPAGRS